MLNPDLDIPSLKARFDEDRRVRIDNFLEPVIAEELRKLIADLPFALTFFSQGQNHVITDQQMAATDMSERQGLQQELLDLASRGIGFLYSSYRMEGPNLLGAPVQLGELLDLLNGDEIQKMVATLTGVNDISTVSGQYTRYTAGHYLTRHSDVVDAERRRLAYVLNFTPVWHPDWGGLLQFYEKSGEPRDAWAPGFNSLALFDVQHIHAVTYVAPHARAPRLSLTGWFRAQ